MNPKISVIVPIYNAEKYMERCIESIRNQTLKDIEIILIDDGSSDRSREIIDRYAKDDDRIRVIYQENSGPSVARNKGINIARGKYIGFVDSDDYIEESMYEILYNLVNKENVQVAMCSYKEVSVYNKTEKIIRPNLQDLKVYNKSEIKNNIISTFAGNENYGFYSLWNKIYQRDWLLNLNIKMDENRDHGEDWWFNICLFSEMESYIFINKTLYNYININNNSLMSKYRHNQFDLFLDGRKKIKSIVPKEFIDDKELNKRFIFEFSSYIFRTFEEIKCKEYRKKLINNVLKNEDVIQSFKNTNNLPPYLKLISFFMKKKYIRVSYFLYKIMSKVRLIIR